MAKLENYKGSIDLISGLRAKNNGDFPLMEAHDIVVDEYGTRLDEKLKNTTLPGSIIRFFRHDFQLDLFDGFDGYWTVQGSVITTDEDQYLYISDLSSKVPNAFTGLEVDYNLVSLGFIGDQLSVINTDTNDVIKLSVNNFSDMVTEINSAPGTVTEDVVIKLINQAITGALEEEY